MKHLRALRRAVLGLAVLPIALSMIVVQTLIMGPIFGNNKILPNIFYKAIRKLFGIKVEFNKASSPIIKDKPVWFVANHMSIADIFVIGGSVDGSFVGKGDFLKYPILAPIMRSAKFIGVRRSAEFNPQSRAKIAENFNAGYNTIMFPEGTTSDGKEVKLFHAGLITVLFGDKATNKKGDEVKLKRDVLVQPVALRVKSVNGENAIGNDKLRNLYSMYNEDSFFKRVYKRMSIKEIIVEVTTLPPLNPKDYKDAKALINKASADVASIVNPGQKTFKKATIPVRQG